MGELRPHNQEVKGSNPTPTFIFTMILDYLRQTRLLDSKPKKDSEYKPPYLHMLNL